LAKQPPIRIGTRASKLAQTQSRLMQARIAAAIAPGEPADAVAPLVTITTSGDRIQDRRLLEAGGKGLFVKELEEALLDGRIDVAVHSMKDVPAELPPGLAIGAVPEREDPRDVLVSQGDVLFEALPKGARVGTASLRRQAQALHRRPDLKIELLRGNVETRLRKLDEGDFDAILLAMAGLKRLGLGGRVSEAFDPVAAPPAPGQGALALEVRAGDREEPWLAALRHGETALAVAAERGALQALEGSCRTAIGAHARIEAGALSLTVEALTPDGLQRFRRQGALATPTDAASAFGLGLDLGQQVRSEAGDRILFA
jgi:hydroxymethylbilane synthase